MSDPQRIGELEIIRRIGAGGFGVVYLAEDHRLKRRVALKLAHPGRGDLQREARAAAKLAHPNVVAIYELGVHEEAPYLVMEYVEGPTLRERLASGEMSRREAMRIARDLGAAIAAAHAEGVMHLDLTPSNVLLSADGRARVVDFGLARAGEGGISGPLTGVAGTPSYMSPEQWRREPVSIASDIWSLGMVLHVLAVGALPVEGATDALRDAVAVPAELRLGDELDRSPLAPIVRRCLRKDPAARPRASELAAQLATLTNDASPFVGLQPLTTDYVGREALIDEVVEALVDEPAVLVTGASGAGKTSFVHGGLLPALRARGWRAIALSANLEQALHQALPGAATATRETAATSLDWDAPEKFASELADAADATGTTLVIVVELDTLDARARGVLAAAIDDGGPVRVIAISRERTNPLAIARVVELPAPTHDELMRMLVEPLRDADITLDAALAAKIADDLVSAPGAQALVQLVGAALWNARRDQRVTEYAGIAAILAPQIAPFANRPGARALLSRARSGESGPIDALVAARLLVVDGDRTIPAFEPMPLPRPSRWRVLGPALAVAAAVPFIVAVSGSPPSSELTTASQCAPWVFPNATMATKFNDPAIQDSFAGISFDARTVLTLRRNCNEDPLYTPTLVDLDDGDAPIALDLSKTVVKTGFHELEGFMSLDPDGLSVIGVLPNSRGFGVTRRSRRGVADFGAIDTSDYAALAVTPPYWVRHPLQSADGLAFYYVINSEADIKHHVMMEALRTSRDVPFEPPHQFPDAYLPARDGAHITGISADRLTVFIQIGYGVIMHARPNVYVPFFDNPRRPIGEPAAQGFRTAPVGNCEMLIGTCVGGCMQEDTCFFTR